MLSEVEYEGSATSLSLSLSLCVSNDLLALEVDLDSFFELPPHHLPRGEVDRLGKRSTTHCGRSRRDADLPPPLEKPRANFVLQSLLRPFVLLA